MNCFLQVAHVRSYRVAGGVMQHVYQARTPQEALEMIRRLYHNKKATAYLSHNEGCYLTPKQLGSVFVVVTKGA